MTCAPVSCAGAAAASPMRQPVGPSGQTIVPRPYQIDKIAAVRQFIAEANAGDRGQFSLPTGTGKTLVMVDAIAEQVANGQHVLVATMSWQLLRQLFDDIQRRHPELLQRIGTVGSGKAKRWLPLVVTSTAQQIVLCTIHSWAQRERQEFEEPQFDRIFIDEVHWGEGAQLYDRLYARYQTSAVFVGATATPRCWSHFKLVGERYDFRMAVADGYLARPILHPTRTGVMWRAEVPSAEADVSASSLRELGANSVRNELDCTDVP